MKKILTFISVMCSMLFLISCGSNKTNESSSDSNQGETKKVAIVYSTGGKGDKSFNDSAFAGLERAKKDLGIEFSEYEPKDPTVEARDQLKAYAETEEYALIIGVGFTMKDSVIEVAEQFPDQNFAIIDEIIEGLPNVQSIVFKEEEGSFLVGALAAMMSETGTIGFLGAVEAPLIQKFQTGYIQGAKYINPDINVVSVFIGGTSAFNDPTNGKAKSEVLIQQGADVLYHAAGGSGAGMFQAVKEKNVYGIGVDSNQDDMAEGLVLTSMMKYVDNAVYDSVKEAIDGKFSPTIKEFGIAEDGVGTTAFEFTRDAIGEEKISRLDEIKELIKKGEIKVKSTL